MMRLFTNQFAPESPTESFIRRHVVVRGTRVEEAFRLILKNDPSREGNLFTVLDEALVQAGVPVLGKIEIL